VTSAPAPTTNADDQELDLVEVEESGPSSSVVLAIAGISLLLVLFVVFGAITDGDVGTMKLVLLVLSLGGASYSAKQIAAADEGDLLKVKERMHSIGGGSNVRQPSVKITGALTDI
jgi:hypothetical protein